MLCASYFVMFSYNNGNGLNQRRRVCFVHFARWRQRDDCILLYFYHTTHMQYVCISRLMARCPSVRRTGIVSKGLQSARIELVFDKEATIGVLTFRYNRRRASYCKPYMTHFVYRMALIRLTSKQAYKQTYDTTRYGRLTCARKLTRWPA